MLEPSAEERLLRGLAELEATRFGGLPPAAPPPGPAPRRSPTSRPAPERVSTTALRRRGPIAALILPAVLGVVSLAYAGGPESSRRGILGFATAVLAAPLLPVAGIPLRSGASLVALAVGASALLWLVIGWWAAQRAAHGPRPTWLGFVIEYAWMVIAIWVGTALAGLAIDLVLGRPLL